MSSGRRSSAELSVIPVQQRQQPPAHMTDEEKQVWGLTVNRLPAEWFPDETLPLLEQYCVHVVRARQFRRELQNPALRPKDRDKLINSESNQTRLVLQLATKMRIAQQSTRTQMQTKPRTVTAATPFDDDD